MASQGIQAAEVATPPPLWHSLLTNGGFVTDDIWTIQRLRDWTCAYLDKHGSLTPRLDTDLLLGEVLKLPRLQLLLRGRSEANLTSPVARHRRTPRLLRPGLPGRQ